MLQNCQRVERVSKLAISSEFHRELGIPGQAKANISYLLGGKENWKFLFFPITNVQRWVGSMCNPDLLDPSLFFCVIKPRARISDIEARLIPCSLVCYANHLILMLAFSYIINGCQELLAAA